MTTAPVPVGQLLRQWRERRRLSQLDLSIQADISARHLSFVETGRSRPTPEMIMRLTEQLDVPLRERNHLLLAGGYGVILMQSSYKVGPLAAGLPGMTVGEPIAGMLIGIFALGEHLGTTPIALAFETLGAAVMIVGCCLLSRSRLVLGRHHPSRHLADQLRAIEARIIPHRADAPPVG